MPGVPPDAFSQVKRAFKGMFRRSKKPKQTQLQHVPQQSQPFSSNEPNNASATPTSRLSPTNQLQIDPSYRNSRISDKPPQLDNPISTGSPFTAEPPKPIHAPQSKAALAPTPKPTTALTQGSATTEDEVKKPTRTYQIVNQEQRASHDVSPAEPSSATTVSAGEKNAIGTGASPPVSAVEDASSMRPPTIAGVRSSEDNRPVSSIESANLHKVDEQYKPTIQQDKAVSSTQQTQPSTVTSDLHREAEQPRVNGDVKAETPQTNGATATTTTSTTTTTAVTVDKDKSLPPPPINTTIPAVSATKGTPAPAQITPRSNSNDEKMAVMQEIPDIKKKDVAPGMSATSGPLEDFFPEAVALEHDGVR